MEDMRDEAGARCVKAFSESGKMAVHLRKHSGEGPYAYGPCGKAFAQSSNLAEHMRTYGRETVSLARIQSPW